MKNILKSAFIYLLLLPLLFLLSAMGGMSLLNHHSTQRAWSSQAAAWLGEAPKGLVHHRHGFDQQLQEWQQEYFSFPATTEQLRTYQSHLELSPTPLPSEPYASIRAAILQEGGGNAVQAIYSRTKPLILQSDFKQYTLTCTPWLVALKDGRAIYLTDSGTLDTLTPTPSVYPELAYHGTSEWVSAAEAGLLLLLLLLPSLLCFITRFRLSGAGVHLFCWQTPLICIGLPLLISLLWFIISPEKNEDGLSTADYALVLNGIFSTALYCLAYLGLRLRRLKAKSKQ